MRVVARRVKRPLNVSVQGPHDTDTRKHRWTSERRDQDQGFHCSLPLRGRVNGLGKRRDAGAGASEIQAWRTFRSAAAAEGWLLD
jgi:hypothetical protein